VDSASQDRKTAANILGYACIHKKRTCKGTKYTLHTDASNYPVASCRVTPGCLCCSVMNTTRQIISQVDNIHPSKLNIVICLPTYKGLRVHSIEYHCCDHCIICVYQRSAHSTEHGRLSMHVYKEWTLRLTEVCTGSRADNAQ